MRCTSEITLKDGTVVPCGTCLICKVNRRNSWAFRLEWEATDHATSLFVGLTFEDDCLPLTRKGNPTLLYDEFTHFLERIRYKFKKDGYNFRYYGIGEYGATTYRPHYHLQLFTDYPIGHKECLYAQDQDSKYCLSICQKDCVIKALRTSWSFGHVTAYPCTPADIRYITLLHVTGIKPPFEDSEPAFTRCSRRPGIGDCFFNHPLVRLSFDHENAIYSYTPAGVLTPLPRYCRDRMFTKAELKALMLAPDDSKHAYMKSQTFASSFMANSYRAKGKI